MAFSVKNVVNLPITIQAKLLSYPHFHADYARSNRRLRLTTERGKLISVVSNN